MADEHQTTDLVGEARFTAKAGIPDFTNAALLDRLADEIERLRSEAAGLREELRIMNAGASHNAAIDRDEIAFWKDRCNG